MAVLHQQEQKCQCCSPVGLALCALRMCRDILQEQQCYLAVILCLNLRPNKSEGKQIQYTGQACALLASAFSIVAATTVRSRVSQDDVKIPEGEGLSSDIVIWHPCDLMQATHTLWDVSLFEKKMGEIIKIVTVPLLYEVIVSTKFCHSFYNTVKRVSLGWGWVLMNSS